MSMAVELIILVWATCLVPEENQASFRRPWLLVALPREGWPCESSPDLYWHFDWCAFVQAATPLRVYGDDIPATSGRHSFAAVLHVLWLLKSFFCLFIFLNVL